MDGSEVDARLRDTRTGVLALANDGVAYAIPLNHYYEDGRLYFRIGYTDDSQKRDFIEATDTATYILHGTEPTDDPREFDSWTIVITGTIRDLTDEEKRTFDTAEINRDFAPIRVFDEDIDEMEITVVELVADTITGRITPNQ